MSANIIVLHTVLPHHHHANLNYSDHTTAHLDADDLIDYLQLIFHADLGAEHMETFNRAEGFDFNNDFSIVTHPEISFVPFAQPFSINSSKGILFPLKKGMIEDGFVELINVQNLLGQQILVKGGYYLTN